MTSRIIIDARSGGRLWRLGACLVAVACSAGGPSASTETSLGAAAAGTSNAVAGRSAVIVMQGGGAGAGTGGTAGATSPPAGASTAGADSACAVETRTAELSPVNIVFVYDKSGSMGNPADGFDPAARREPMQAGMQAFFSDPSSGSLSAALAFFPVNGDLSSACSGPYDSPQSANPRGLALTALNTEEGRGAFLSLLKNTSPQGGTPTLPALEGGARLAHEIATDHPGEKTVIVLVTDGEPGFFVEGQVVEGCTDNDVTHIAQVAAGALGGTPSIPTFVVGIGPSLDSLQAIAQAGGTEHATIMSDADPATTSASFHETLAAIRSATFSCDFPLPKPPLGQTFDAVNVAFKSSQGSDTTIARNDACSPGGGWHYDVPMAPRKIVLCQDSCDLIQSDTDGRLSVVFGCATVVR
jgi:hypothetical protein